MSSATPRKIDTHNTFIRMPATVRTDDDDDEEEEEEEEEGSTSVTSTESRENVKRIDFGCEKNGLLNVYTTPAALGSGTASFAIDRTSTRVEAERVAFGGSSPKFSPKIP